MPSFNVEYKILLSGNERWIETPDGKLGGYVDKIVHTSVGYEIIDYKTGEVKGQNGIKTEYSTQLMLYAGILYESSGEWPGRETAIISNPKP
ncbi:PD-(D/E)XK nuclease superfamily protein [Paenibacillus sp. yr247]|uniref:PD-(D/E)XK nuclease family protein n=1 Tax=Paenibacillus sp. yr247 TaxID=1761880 RepID=UPI000882A375|nr:PD-(D/E)XK nuclease family protein [Paenibacillus sp. yr247]SDO58350.1 PD-(D/E)XK nuclease superfamily protein [Paenibacillus sp. yr247]